MNTYQEPAHDIPITRQADVIVIGGGPAGLATAIASARNGARTVLVERFGYLGGTATASLMACINGFRNQVAPDDIQTVRGIAEEIILQLKELDGLGKSPYPQRKFPTTPGKLAYSYAIDTEKFKYVILKLCVEAGVELLFHSWFCQPVMDGKFIHGVIIENKSGRQALLAKVVVDASGDGDVAARAGAPFWQTTKDEALRLNDSLMYRLEFGARRPPEPFACDFGSHAVVWGPGVEPIDGTSVEELSRAEIDARLRVYQNFTAKQAQHPELADARVVETPPQLGVRQTRFIVGDYTLTAEDTIQGQRFEDVIAISSCPIIAYYGYRRYLEHQGYDIPYRCLLPQKVENLLVAGRCISSQQQPYESHRAVAPVMAIGQAAGTAAALASKYSYTPRKLDVNLLQETLAAQNAVLKIPEMPK